MKVMEMLESKKAKAFIGSLIAALSTAVAGHLGVDPALVSQLLWVILGLGSSYMVSQGVVDALQARIDKAVENPLIDQIKEALRAGNYIGLSQTGEIIIDTSGEPR